MTIKVLGFGSGLQWFSRQCGARLFSGCSLVFLVAASALAGTEPSHPTASGPADVAAATSRKCTTAIVKDQPVRASQNIPASALAAEGLTTMVDGTPDDRDSPSTEILQDKLWSTRLSGSSKNDAPKTPQCGTTTPSQTPAN